MRLTIRPVLLFLLLLLPFLSPAQNIYTIAGNGYYSYSGDGGPATNAQFYIPNGLAFDASGNLFVADKFNSVVRKITPAGIVTTYAGNGIADYTGDGVAATATSLNTVLSITIDAAGNLYIPDFANNRIRKVDHSGIITTVAGNGYPGYFGDNAPATDAKLYGPGAVAFDAAGNMYISDIYNNVVRKVSTSGIITRFAGNASIGYSGDGGMATNAQLTNPTGLLVDPAGNLLICDYSNSRIRKVTPAGIITTIAGSTAQGYSGDGGPATNAQLRRPNSIYLDPSGNLYIADVGNFCIRKVNSAGIISTIAGTGGLPGFYGDGGPATAALILGPEAVTLDPAGNIYIGDSGSFRIRKINTAGIMSTYAGGMGEGNQATANSMNVFHTIVDQAGNLIVTDADNNRICKIDKMGAVTTIVGDLAPGYSGDGGPASAAQIDYPVGVTIDAANNLYFIDQDNSMIRKISSSGIISTIAGNGLLSFGGDNGPATAAALHFPMSLVIDPSGNIYFSDKTNNRVRKISASGIMTTIAGNGTYTHTGDGGPATASTLENPVGIALDIDGNIYESNAGDGTICKIDKSGIITTVAGTGVSGTSGDGGPATAARLNVTGIWVDSFYNIFVADGRRLCRKINAHGIISTVAGSATAGFSGDGGPATAAQLFTDGNVATDAAGNIYISDYDNYRLRMVQTSQLPRINVPIICTGTSTAKLSDATTGGTWTSSATTVATIGSSSGIITALSPGTSTIIYDVAGNTMTATITVRALATVAAITGATSVCAGGATITLSDATPGGTWNASNANATVAGGVVTGVTGGTCTISYTITDPCGAAVATYTITVKPLPAVSAISGTATVCAGSTVTLSDATPSGTWSVSNTNSSITTGGVVTGVKAGTSIVSYSVTNACGTTPATMTLTVNPLPNAGTITGPGRVCEAASITLSDTSPGGTWNTSNTNTSITGGGVVTGITTGSSTISYTVNNSCGTATATVTILVDPLPHAGTITGPSSICTGRTITLSDAAGAGTWSTSNTNISLSGAIVVGLATGTAVVSYSVANICGTAIATDTITVKPLPFAGSVSGPSVVCVGASIILTDATTGGVWTTSNSNASVTTGTVTGNAAGAAIVSYSVSNMCGTDVASMGITVNPLPDAGTLSGSSNVCVGSVIIIAHTATGGIWSHSGTHVSLVDSMLTGTSEGSDIISYTVTNSCGTDVATQTLNVHPLPGAINGPAQVCIGSSVTLTDGTPDGSWTGSDTTMATVAVTKGIVYGLSAGTPFITYTSADGCIATRAIIVEQLPAAISGDNRVCVNANGQLSDADAGGHWRSANNSLASIDSVTGVIHGVAQGVISITYTLASGCTNNKLINIDPLPYILPVTGADKVCVDSEITLTDAVSGGTWASTNSNAAVSTTGVVSGRAPGSDTVVYTINYICGVVTTTFPLAIGDCNNPNAPVKMKIYPSPNEGSFTIDLSSDANKDGDVYITNVLGQKVYTNTISTNIPLPVTFSVHQASGVYLVTVLLGDNKYETKIVLFH